MLKDALTHAHTHTQSALQIEQSDSPEEEPVNRPGQVSYLWERHHWPAEEAL